MKLLSVRRGSWAQAGLGARIFVAFALVIAATTVTLLLVTVVAAPLLFRLHLESVGVEVAPEVAAHVDEGFTFALITSITAAVLAASLIAVVVAAVVARRISRPVGVAAETAGRLADGEYGVRMPAVGAGPELDELASAVNALAQRLETAEAHRMRLLADLAHELRTPLAALDATVEAIVDGMLPADAESLETLAEQTGRLTRLTRDLQAVSRSDEHAFRVERRRMNLTGAVEAAVAAQRARYQSAGVGLMFGAAAAATSAQSGNTPSRQPVYGWADPDRVGEILDQLLDNALRHCEDGETVTVSVHRQAETVSVVVTDTGAGFAPAVAEQLFGRFYRGPDSRRGPAGTGLGLTIARSLAAAQGGTLHATSPGAGRGATFTLTLPASP